jgi:hypothetical protein
MDNPETQTLEKTEESIKNGQSRDADLEKTEESIKNGLVRDTKQHGKHKR